MSIPQLNLRKEKVLNLKKSVGLDGQLAYVCAVYDKSGSMEHLYKNGFVQRLTERVLPIGMAFDDNQSVDLFVFHTKSYQHKEPISTSNYTRIVSDIMRDYDWDGTNYAPPINQILDQYSEKGGWFGGGKRKAKKLKYPVYVLYFTDGANDDKRETEELLREASNHGIFFQFVGIGNARFDFLQKLDDLDGRFIDNADFFQANDLDSITDDQLYARLMTEFPEYVKQARAKGLIA